MPRTLDYHHQKNIAKFNQKEKRLNDRILRCRGDASNLEKQKQELLSEEIGYYMDMMDLLTAYYLDTPNAVSITSEELGPCSNSKQVVTNLKEYMNTRTTVNKTKIYEEYLYRLNQDASKQSVKYNVTRGTCSNCSQPQTLDVTLSLYICESCGNCTHAHVDTEMSCYVKNPVLEMNNSFSYKRFDHFVKWLDRFHNTEKSKVPQHILELIQKELKKLLHNDSASLTKQNILEILKTTGNSKYSSQVLQILNKIKNEKSPTLPIQVQQRMKIMFMQTQKPFAQICPQDRTNFLSYSYVIRKFLELLNLPEYIDYFPLLKSKDKLHQQDQLWRKICQQLGWTYKPSI